MTCSFSGFSGSLEQMSTFASTYIHFPSKVAEIAILGWGGGGLLFCGGFIVYTFRLLVVWASRACCNLVI